MTTSQTAKGYVAGELGYVYPELGEALPPGGAKVLLLTNGGICVSGIWSDRYGFLAWSPMPRRSDYTYPTGAGEGRPGSSSLLLLTTGGICVFGPWSSDGRYLGWANLPRRDQAKEDAIRAKCNQREWRMAA